MAFIRLPYKTKEEWLSLRKLGGSDASSIIGMNPYRSNFELWQELVGLRERQSVDNKFTRYGTAAEEPLRELMKLHFKDYESDIDFLNITHSNEVLARVDKPYLTASLDGEIEVLKDFKFMSYWKANYVKDNEGNAIVDLLDIPNPILLQKGMKGVLEIKTTDVLSSMHKEKWNNHIPQNYYVQCLHYLNVTGYDFVILMAQLKFTNKYDVVTYENRFYGFLRVGREEDLIYLENEMDKFNYQVENKIEPAQKINF